MMGGFTFALETEIFLQLMVGFCLALANLVLDHYVRFIPYVIKILPRLSGRNWARVLGIAYLIALILQVATSPFFATQFRPIAAEIAWSPLQALLNLVGVMIVDLAVMIYQRLRSGGAVVASKAAQLQDQAADVAQNIAAAVPGSEAAATRAKEQHESDAAAAEERRKRLDERLGRF